MVRIHRRDFNPHLPMVLKMKKPIETYKNVYLGISESGKPLIYSPEMHTPKLKQSYPLKSKLSVKALKNNYRGENRLAVNAILNALLK